MTGIFEDGKFLMLGEVLPDGKLVTVSFSIFNEDLRGDNAGMNKSKKAIALGFDGVHRGHAELLKKTTEAAKLLGASPAVMTFDVSPDRIVSGKRSG